MTSLVALIGTLGTLCFALSGIPAAIKSIRDGHARGMATATVWLWLLGEVCYVVYIGMTSCDPILMVNYIANMIIVGVIAFYVHFPRVVK